MILIEIKMKKIQENIVENKKELSNLEYELLNEGRENGILIKMSYKLEELDNKLDKIEREIDYLPSPQYIYGYE